MWIVTSGEYSNYRVHCICRDQDTANEIVKRMNNATHFGDEFTATEIPCLDPGDDLSPHVGVEAWLDRETGQVGHSIGDDEVRGPWKPREPSIVDETERYIHVSARTLDEAIKALHDRHAFLKAQEHGL